MPGVEQIPWVYDLFMSLVERFGLRSWRLALLRGSRGRILDLGCGTGRNLDLLESDQTVVGAEPSLRLLQAARSRMPVCALVAARAEALPFRSTSFDTVISSLVFCSVADPLQGLAETARVLDPTGELRMLEHVRSDHRVLGWLQDRAQPVWTWVAGGCHPNRRTEATVEEAGFVIEGHAARGRTTLRCFVARVPRTAPGVD